MHTSFMIINVLLYVCTVEKPQRKDITYDIKYLFITRKERHHATEKRKLLPNKPHKKTYYTMCIIIKVKTTLYSLRYISLAVRESSAKPRVLILNISSNISSFDKWDFITHLKFYFIIYFKKKSRVGILLYKLYELFNFERYLSRESIVICQSG